MRHMLISRFAMAAALLCAATVAVAVPASAGAQGAAPRAGLATLSPCTSSRCSYTLGIDPKLLSGPDACPAIQNARAYITISNRFATGALNDGMTLKATGLPANTGFDMFLVQNSPLDSGTFSGFGDGWYQSDVQSNAYGNATVSVRGIFDKETFIEDPSSNGGFTPIHTFNVGFWFNSPSAEQQVCGGATPPTTPFNGEQDAGLLAVITQGEPLQFVQ